MKTITCTLPAEAEMPSLSGEELFFDIETTGLNWRQSHLYLIGAACFCPSENCWKLTQWFADQPHLETDLLEAFAAYAAPFQKLIHYNGSGFDLPYLEKKYGFYRLDNPLSALPFVDLYRVLRPYQKLFDLSSMKQKALEAYIGFSRRDTFSGGELIPVYEAYLSSGDEKLLDALLLHNKEDVLGMCQILRLAEISALFDGNFSVTEVFWAPQPECPCLTIRFSPEKPLAFPLSMQTPFFSLKLSKTGGEIMVRGIRDELKFFFPDYKNYYYLPLEDHAIHKSIGAFVDPSHREKAKASNCYQRRHGIFFWQPSPVLTPAFRRDYKDKASFFEWNENYGQQPLLLKEYLLALLQCACHEPTP